MILSRTDDRLFMIDTSMNNANLRFACKNVSILVYDMICD